jgi:hypothetical protein
MVKASTIARDLSKRALEDRLGPFEASSEKHTCTPKRSYQKAPMPMRIDTAELYARYKNEQKNLALARSDALSSARRRKDRAVEDAKRANRLRRATIKVVDGRTVSKKVLYSQASKALRASLDAIHAEYTREREKLFQGFQPRTWADWLKVEAMQGNHEALSALRARDAAKGLQGHTLTGHGGARGSSTPEIDNITKKGTIIYRAGQTAVRDDGDKLQVSRANDQRGLQAALRMAAERYGSRITVTGDAEFKARIIHAAVDGRLSITFADPGLERRRQELLQPRSKSKGSVASLRSRVSPIGQQPPPQRRNQLHSLGQLPVLHIAASEQVMQPQAPQAPSPAETIALRQAKLRAEQAAKKAKRQGKGRAR